METGTEFGRARWLRPAAAVASATYALCAAQAPDTPAAQSVTITATRIATPAFDVPASITLVTLSPDTDTRPGINISETLGGVPGLLARDRQNYAQDVQISVRGFGARSTFGIRGVRVYIDGIPGTMPDGQGQISNVDLGTAAAIEVLRGPFSALYGNSSGGVVQVFTEDGGGSPKWTFGGGAGSNHELRYDGKLTGAEGNLDYVASVSHFETDGYRQHSAARRDIENVKLGLRLDERSRITIVGNGVELPYAQDALGLSRVELQTIGPRAADPSAIQFNTRKSLAQTQAGVIYDLRVDADNALRAMVYGGHRDTEQFQSIPVTSQASATAPGGVIQLGRDYDGADLRWTTQGIVDRQRWSLVGGLAYDKLREHRYGYQSFIGTGGAQVVGVQGALRRNEINDVQDLDPYLQGEWHPADAWTLDAGVRHSSVRFVSHDEYIVGTNPNDSGGANYSATLPVLGVLYALRPDVHFYATAGKGFETPTLNEIAYRPDKLTGLNFDLKPSRSKNLELGVKTQSATWGVLDAAVFGTRTTNEIVTLSNTGGRSTYQNAASTRRLGLELEWSKPLPHDLNAQVAYTLLDAQYTDAFAECVTTPCASTHVASGNRIPGVARNALFASLAWAPAQGWRAGVEARALSRVFVNDTNADPAASFVTANLSGGYLWPLGHWQWSAFGRVDNVTGRRYIGSVIVNEGNGRYFEPAPGRAYFAGLTGSYRF
ncbi:TonB-dependent receptor family protein [Scleromatobacter humisilvae]|uniref:TonB-dependent receptor n=1 Tax=Scleromatobacter humisilvae TaxID=2897159 RepID=A0A9X2BZ78_9BURK|nr:TonB-dependent receptor [Scleromatobacter humisilvae]MCK9685036.1 TonB-dependent receptor [Scleromatobacter humisilvae]